MGTLPLLRRIASFSFFLPASPPLPSSRSLHRHHPPSSTLKYIKDFTFIINNLTRNPNDPKLLSALDSALSVAPSLHSATSVLVLLRGLSLAKKLNRAKSLLTTLKTNASIPDPFLYSLVLQCILPISPIRDVESVWAEISPPSINTAHFVDYPSRPSQPMNVSDFVVYLCRNSKDLPEVESVYRRISSSRWRVTRQAYVSLIAAMCRKHRQNPSLARSVLSEMEEMGFEAYGPTFFLLFRSFCMAGDLVEADSVLKSMVERKNYDLGISVYECFLHGLCRRGKFKEARKLFDKMSKRDPVAAAADTDVVLKPGRRVIFQLRVPASVSDAMAFKAYFMSLCSAGKTDDAERLLEDALSKNSVLEASMYTSFVGALFCSGRADDAIKFFEAERNKGHVCATDIGIAVVRGLCEKGKVDDGNRILHDMVNDGFVPTTQVWNHVLQCYLERERTDDAVRLLDEIRNACSGDGGGNTYALMYNLMIDGLLRKGDIEMAMSLMDNSSASKIHVNVASIGIARCLFAQRRFEEAHSCIDNMIENGELVSYAAWESLFDSLAMDSEDGILLNSGSSMHLEKMR